jgi:hypothetical protein
MRRFPCPIESDCRFTLNWMQRIQNGFPCGAWEPGKNALTFDFFSAYPDKMCCPFQDEETTKI